MPASRRDYRRQVWRAGELVCHREAKGSVPCRHNVVIFAPNLTQLLVYLQWVSSR